MDGGTNIQGKLSTLNRIQSYDGKENNGQQEIDKQNQYLRRAVVDVFGKETFYDYLRCHHKFLEHGLIRVNVNIHETVLPEHINCIVVDGV